jgi:hypothetical protein
MPGLLGCSLHGVFQKVFLGVARFYSLEALAPRRAGFAAGFRAHKKRD